MRGIIPLLFTIMFYSSCQVPEPKTPDPEPKPTPVEKCPESEPKPVAIPGCPEDIDYESIKNPSSALTAYIKINNRILEGQDVRAMYKTIVQDVDSMLELLLKMRPNEQKPVCCNTLYMLDRARRHDILACSGYKARIAAANRKANQVCKRYIGRR